MTTVTGAMNRNTAMFGTRVKLRPVGLPTAMAIGTGSAPGAGPGWTIRLGGSRRTITAVGIISRAVGAGVPDRIMVTRSMDRLSSVSSVAVLALESNDIHSLTANRFSRGSVAAMNS